MVPKGRWLTPEDHGRVTVFLCSEAADALCGLAIDVDGGSLLDGCRGTATWASAGGSEATVNRAQQDRRMVLRDWSSGPCSSTR
jgi:hypothetical protein